MIGAIKRWWREWRESRRRCDYCDTYGAKTVDRGTAYVDNDRNVADLCESCHQHDKEWVEEMWREYYSGRL